MRHLPGDWGVISEVGYGPRASDTWRWVDEPADVPIGAFVGQLADRDPGNFAPTADLVDMAYRVAEVREADRYHVESIEVADEFWLFPWDHVGDTEVVEVNRRQVDRRQRQGHRRWERFQPIEVFIVEYPGEQDAALVAAAADRWDHDEEIQIAVAKGRILMVLCIRYRDEPYTETLAELERFRSGLQASL